MSKNVPNWSKVGSFNPDSKKVKLSHAVPLPTPFLVFIDPSSACNFRCKFCPTGHLELRKQEHNYPKIMDFSLFEKILQDLALFPNKAKVLFFHKDGEPLVNPKLGDMMSLAVQKDVAEKYWLTTNASLITQPKAEEIVSSGIDVVRLSIEHVSSEGYKLLTQNFSKYDQVVRAVTLLWEERERKGSKMRIYAKLIDFDFTEEQLEKFSRDFGSITDEVLLTQPNGWSRPDAFDFTLGVKPKAGHDGESRLAPERIACINPFYNFAINADGRVGLCPVDWSHGTVVGDVRQESLLNIWNGLRARELQVLHLSGRRHENKACKNCECVPYSPESELDEDRDRLLPLFEELLRNAH
jgi:radical SAM protein with 4Fe4S-binding SPASM domain